MEQISKNIPKNRLRSKQSNRSLPQIAIDIMTIWYDKHYVDPYPSFRDCEIMANNGGISVNQVKQWFVNIRRRTQNQFRRSNVRSKQKRREEENIDYEEENVKRVKNETINPYIQRSYNFNMYREQPSNFTAYANHYNYNYTHYQSSPSVYVPKNQSFSHTNYVADSSFYQTPNRKAESPQTFNTSSVSSSPGSYCSYNSPNGSNNSNIYNQVNFNYYSPTQQHAYYDYSASSLSLNSTWDS